METYNSRVDQKPGAPPILRGMDTKKIVQKPFPPSVAPKPIPKKFRMPDIPKYNGTIDPNEYVTSYTCAIKGNDLEDDEIKSALLKEFGETLSKGAMIWYHNLPRNSIDSFVMLADSFIKANGGAIKVAAKKSDLFKSKIRVEDDQLGATSGLVYPNRLTVKNQRDVNREPRSNRDQYQPYTADQRNNGSGRNSVRNDRRSDRRQNSRELMSKSGFDNYVDPTEAPRLSEYNLIIDASGIVSAIGRIRDTRWPKPIQIDPSQRNPNLMCKYHGTHVHKTEDYKQLREEVACLFNEGHLREFLSDRAKNHFRERDANRKHEQEEPNMSFI
ncbi:uncharacterized protein [Nicotiana tomentosiformis]|uniref:uncharacterized protein n=1 Tax=Nicotiana tomentosiformis TaxID=4098 RepID=UPI00388C4ADD